MADLTQEKCVACNSAAPKVTAEEMATLKPQIPDWAIVEVEGVPRLVRLFKFKDFAQALSFTNRVGALAEEEGHHPALLTEWGKVTVSWWTHDIGGLHRNDLIMASRTDRLYQSTGDKPN